MRIMLLISATTAFKASNIARFPNFAAARDVLASKDSKVNTFAVLQAAAAVPTDAWNAVAPAEIWLTLPSPDDAAATQKLLRKKLSSLRGLSDDHAETLGAMVGALSADFARCCEFGCLDECCSDHEKIRAVRAKLSVAALDDARAAQPCPRFHADTVPMRLIATLAERGTEVLSDAAVVQIGTNAPTKLVNDVTPHTMSEGDAVVLLGRLAKGGARRPSVHRSPPPGPPRAGRRVVLVLDEEETAPPPPGSAFFESPRVEVAKRVKKLLLQ